jgi:FKBP12-rapamycin complex-associated protein
LEDIFDMIKEFWTADSPLQSTIILLVEAIAVALQSEFKEGGGERIYLVLMWVDAEWCTPGPLVCI